MAIACQARIGSQPNTDSPKKGTRAPAAIGINQVL